MSLIKTRARSHIPFTWQRLEEASAFGPELIDLRVNSVKESVFGTVISDDSEATYPGFVLDYVGRLVAIELIEPGIEYWLTQPISFSATGSNETKMFVDRAEKLARTRDTLIAKAREDQSIVQELLASPTNLRRKKKVISVGEANNDLMVTPDPYGFERPFAQPKVVAF